MEYLNAFWESIGNNYKQLTIIVLIVTGVAIPLLLHVKKKSKNPSQNNKTENITKIKTIKNSNITGSFNSHNNNNFGSPSLEQQSKEMDKE